VTVEITPSLLKRANVGPMYWPATVKGLLDVQKGFSGKERSSLLAYVRDINRHLRWGRGVFFAGKNSVGKTTLSVALLKIALQCGKTALFIEYPTFCSAVRQSMLFRDLVPTEQDVEEEETTVFDRTLAVDFLVLDNLGSEHRTQSGYTEKQFEILLRMRQRNLKATTLTTNLSPKVFDSIYGVSTVELIKASTVPVLMDGINLRTFFSEKPLGGKHE